MGRTIQNNFSGGVLSPSLYGRSDLQAYYKGAAVAENFIVAKEGSLRKRHGISSFLAIGPYASQKVVPYRYDRTVAGFFVLANTRSTILTATYYLKGGEKKQTVSISGFAGDIKELQAKQIGDQVWISNEEFFRILNVADAQSFTVEEWKQATTPSTIPHYDNVSASSTHWGIAPSKSCSGKTIYYGVITCKDSVNSSTSKGEVSWSSSWEAGTYIDVYVVIKIADLSKWDYVIVAKRSGGSYGELTRHYMDDEPDHYYNGAMTEVFESTYEDASGNALWFTIATVYKWSSGGYYDKAEGSDKATQYYPQTRTYVRFDFRDDNISAGEAVYGQTNVLGEGFTTPLCVDCFQQRRVFGNAAIAAGGMPMTLWFSEVGNLNNFYADRPTADDDAFSTTISSTGPAFIRWIISYNEMLVLLTDSGLFSVGFSQTSGFSASSCRISKFSDLSVSPDVQPVVTDAGVVFVAADNKTIYTASYDIQENMLKPINRTVLVEHLTRTSRIKALALQTSPDNVVWAIMENGRYATFTFERNEEVYAWSDGYIQGAPILDVISLGSVTDSSVDRTYSDLLFVVQNGNNAFLCRFNNSFADKINGTTTNVAATLTTLRPESQERTIVGIQKNVKDVLVRLYRTGGISVKPASGGDSVPLVNARMTLDKEGLFTGDVKVVPRGVINENGQMTFVSDDGKACEILQIILSMEVAQ